MKMLSRDEKGRLQLRTLDMQVIIDGWFMECQTEKEVEWLQENIESMVERSVEDSLEIVNP